MIRIVCFLCAAIAARMSAATVPAGTELSVRLSDKVSTATPDTTTPVHALLIMPVVINGSVVIPAGVELTGKVKSASAAADKDPARLQLVFTDISSGSYHTGISAVIKSLDNSRETVDDKGEVVGINGSETYSARLDQGISKLQNNSRFAGLAGLIQTARSALEIKEADANIDFEPGVEITLALSAPLDWKGSTKGPESKLQPVANESAVIGLVNRQPFRTQAENPPRPSDITNLMFIGTQEQLRAAFEKAGWSMTAALSAQSKLETARALIEARGYKEGPMSVLLLDGNPPDMAWQKGNNTFAQRHHLRIFRRPDTFEGKPMWVCSSTHDTGIDFSERDRTFIHKVDSDIDRERAKVVSDLLLTGMVRSLMLVQRTNIPPNLTNATGDVLQTDGAMAVLIF